MGVEKINLKNNMDPYIERLENKRLKHLVVDSAGKIPIDFADALKTAEYYTGSWLIAKKPVDVFNTASLSGVKVKTVPVGNIVGRIYSYVQKDGKVFWQLEGGSGNGTGGFVVHEPYKFDTKIALDSSDGLAHDQQLLQLQNDPVTNITEGIGNAVSGVGKTLSLVGDNLIWVILAVVIFLVATSIHKLKTV